MLRKIIALAGVILALVPFVIFPVCDTMRPDGSHMACWYSGMLITIMGTLIFLLQFVKRFTAAGMLLTLCLALSCWFIPNRIIAVSPFGLCSMPEHACRAETMPAVGVMVIVITAMGITGIVMDFVRG